MLVAELCTVPSDGCRAAIFTSRLQYRHFNIVLQADETQDVIVLGKLWCDSRVMRV